MERDSEEMVTEKKDKAVTVEDKKDSCLQL